MPGQAATIGSMHSCPMCTGGVPHGESPISSTGEATVLIGGKPAAVIGDICICSGGSTDTIVKGSSTVFIGGKPAVTVGDNTAHGGAISTGEASVLIDTSKATRSTITPLEEIPFPKITMAQKTLAAITGSSNSLKEAQTNQEELKKESEKHGYLENFLFSAC